MGRPILRNVLVHQLFFHILQAVNRDFALVVFNHLNIEALQESLLVLDLAVFLGLICFEFQSFAGVSDGSGEEYLVVIRMPILVLKPQIISPLLRNIQFFHDGVIPEFDFLDDFGIRVQNIHKEIYKVTFENKRNRLSFDVLIRFERTRVVYDYFVF